MSDHRYSTATEAAAALGVSVQTLYSYTSRGMIHSEPLPGKPRSRRYVKADVERLKEKAELRRDPEKVSRRSLQWGGPVLESAITLIEDGRLYYRGHDVVELARFASVQEVAALLWTSEIAAAPRLFIHPRLRQADGLAAIIKRAKHLSPIERCQVALPWAASADLAAYDLRPQAVASKGVRILELMAMMASGGETGRSADVTLQHAWVSRKTGVRRAIRAAMILSADHELNVSAFAARCVASAASSPYDVVSAGLAALKGARHGGMSARVEALFQETGTPARAAETIAGRLRRGERIAGFGHPLYPEGDPRGRLLLSLAEEMGRSAEFALARALAQAAMDLTGEHPTIDFGLAALSRSLGFPQGSPLVLFALGRTIGWIAHAIEQYQAEVLIRPRAHYIGPSPLQ